MRFYNIAAFAVLSLSALSGCTTTTGSSSLQREVDALKVEVADLRDNSRLADMRGSSSTDAAEISRLRSQVQRLSENADSTGDSSDMSTRRQLDQISARLDRLEQRAGLGAQNTVSADPGPSTVAGGSAAPNGYAPPPSTYRGPDEYPSTAGADDGSPVRTAGPYEEGKSLFDKKQYPQAINQFKAYLSSDASGQNAAAAQFYIGESLYAQRQYADAILEYQKVIQDHSKSSHVPTSLLKQGLSFQAIGEKDSAKLLYQKIIRDHPKSYAAGIARERMQKL